MDTDYVTLGGNLNFFFRSFIFPLRLLLFIFFALTSTGFASIDIKTCYPIENLENPRAIVESSRRPCTRLWMEELSAATRSRLDSSPIAQNIQTRLNELKANTPPTPMAVAGRTVQIKSIGIVDISTQPEKVLVSSELLTTGQNFSLIVPSPDGRSLAFGVVDRKHSDVTLWRFFDLSNNQLLPDPSIRVRYDGFRWSLDSKGLFYSVWPNQEQEDQRLGIEGPRTLPVAYHELGRQGQDPIIFNNPPYEPNALFEISGSLNDKNLIAHRDSGVEMPLSVLVGKKNGDTRRWTSLFVPRGKRPIRGRYIWPRG